MNFINIFFLNIIYNAILNVKNKKKLISLKYLIKNIIESFYYKCYKNIDEFD